MYFLNLIPLKKGKKGLFNRVGGGTSRTEVAHGGHVTKPREPTWTPTW